MILHRWCLPGSGYDKSATRDIETTFLYRPDPFSSTRGQTILAIEHHSEAAASLLPSGRGGAPSLSNIGTSLRGILGPETFLSMKKFVKQEEEHEGRKAELEVKQRIEQLKAL